MRLLHILMKKGYIIIRQLKWNHASYIVCMEVILIFLATYYH